MDPALSWRQRRVADPLVSPDLHQDLACDVWVDVVHHPSSAPQHVVVMVRWWQRQVSIHLEWA